jgi:NTE family protein
VSKNRPLRRKSHVVAERPPFERIALILQGGGALGSYQAGVYQALAEANLHPDWVAGISIGALNSALIAGNAPKKRVEVCVNSGRRLLRLRSEYRISHGSTSKASSPTA